MSQEAAQYLQKGCSRKMPPSFSSFSWGRLLEHSFLEHFFLDQFSVFQGKFYLPDSRTPRLVEHFWVPISGASCSNKLFVGTLRPSEWASAPVRLQQWLKEGLGRSLSAPHLCDCDGDGHAEMPVATSRAHSDGNITRVSRNLSFAQKKGCLFSCVLSKSQKSLGAHKILFRKIWFYPPPPTEKRPKWGKTVQISIIFKIETFSGGGAGNAILWKKRFYGHLGVSEKGCSFSYVLSKKSRSKNCAQPWYTHKSGDSLAPLNVALSKVLVLLCCRHENNSRSQKMFPGTNFWSSADGFTG